MTLDLLDILVSTIKFDIKYGRVHLPVAPKCNVQCNFCNRRHDCVNESRPGVTSRVLSPGQALHYLHEVVIRKPNLTRRWYCRTG